MTSFSLDVHRIFTRYNLMLCEGYQALKLMSQRAWNYLASQGTQLSEQRFQNNSRASIAAGAGSRATGPSQPASVPTLASRRPLDGPTTLFALAAAIAMLSKCISRVQMDDVSTDCRAAAERQDRCCSSRRNGRNVRVLYQGSMKMLRPVSLWMCQHGSGLGIWWRWIRKCHRTFYCQFWS